MFGLAVSRDPKRSRHDASPLTHRQHEVLVLLADGASTEAIASRLFLSEQTVRNHVRHILQRLDCNSRLSAVAVARRNGYV
jgi:DNA-binding NarL/FixJ family response regulator